MLRSIPGDDSGLLEEIVLVVDKEFIREKEFIQEKEAASSLLEARTGDTDPSLTVTRTKWFTSSLEQMELVSQSQDRRGGAVQSQARRGGVDQSQARRGRADQSQARSDGRRSGHVMGDTVTVRMVFSTVRSEARERLYTMSEAGHATLMAVTSGVLEANTR